MTLYTAKQWDIDRLEYLEDRLLNYILRGVNDIEALRLLRYDLKAEIEKLKRQGRRK